MAAFILRRHTAASTAKVAANALAPAGVLTRTPGNVDEALRHCEPGQLALGNGLHEQGHRAGDYLLFQKLLAVPDGPNGRARPLLHQFEHQQQGTLKASEVIVGH